MYTQVYSRRKSVNVEVTLCFAFTGSARLRMRSVLVSASGSYALVCNWVMKVGVSRCRMVGRKVYLGSSSGGMSLFPFISCLRFRLVSIQI